jgi:hypothetical protein
MTEPSRSAELFAAIRGRNFPWPKQLLDVPLDETVG